MGSGVPSFVVKVAAPEKETPPIHVGCDIALTGCEAEVFKNLLFFSESCPKIPFPRDLNVFADFPFLVTSL